MSKPIATPMDSDLVPLGLRHALESGSCVLFVGAGIGANVKDATGQPGPNGEQLARDLAAEFGINVNEHYDLAKIAEIVELRKGRTELETFVKKRLSGLEPDDPLRWLFSIRWKAIFTTNYDRVIERAYELNPKPLQRPCSVSITPELVPLDARFDVPIYHLHGSLFGPGDPAIIITEADYAKFRERRKMLFEMLKMDSATATILYVGYSNRDPNWKTVRQEIAAEFYPSRMPPAYRIAPGTDALDVEILRASGIETIDATLEQFASGASAVLRDLVSDIDRLKRLGTSVPADLANAFDNNPAAVLRLLASWLYVNRAPFDEVPNTQPFLHGDRANWGLIARRLHFERDLEEEIYEDLLDYATQTTPKAKSLIVLGPAGYGVTTILLSLGARLVSERAGAVFMHRPGTALVEGDIEFACSLFPNQRPFFIVDNAADHGEAIHYAASLLGSSSRPALFLLGERRNEWRQGHGTYSPKEFDGDVLTDPEIHKLLACLAKNGALGALSDLAREIQVATIRSRLQKDLLVTMREATEDKRFDAIIEDEYLGIGDELSRRVYLAVCGFYQHGAYARDSLVADLVGKSVVQLYSETGAPTEGVVIYDCIDPSADRYAARARHRSIATVVWERCGDPTEKESLLTSAIGLLNVTYRSDKEAFEQFIRSDRTVDTIRTLDGKIQFFETACRKEPESPYVKQHYARMLLREDKLELALGQIDDALKLDATIRVLHHTRGMILAQLAKTTPSPDMARRRLAQSEQSFRHGLTVYDRDEYFYQGLATLYLDWATRVPDPEATEYINKAEGVISEGLRRVRVRDGLWIISSNIENLLGNQPARIAALERAVAEAPGSIYARYSLGRVYRRNGDPGRAITILDPVIKNHSEEFRACIEYALALRDLGEPYSKSVAVLKLGTLYGLSDPRFIATLGGMLFMNRDFSEAQKVFGETVKKELPYSEGMAIHFRPSDPGDRNLPFRLDGKVLSVRGGYASIGTEDYPPFSCPLSRCKGLWMSPGLEISFEPAFCSIRPLADRPRVR